MVSLAGGQGKELLAGVPDAVAGSDSVEEVRLGMVGGHNSLKLHKQTRKHFKSLTPIFP